VINGARSILQLWLILVVAKKIFWPWIAMAFRSRFISYPNFESLLQRMVKVQCTLFWRSEREFVDHVWCGGLCSTLGLKIRKPQGTTHVEHGRPRGWRCERWDVPSIGDSAWPLVTPGEQQECYLGLGLRGLRLSMIWQWQLSGLDCTIGMMDQWYSFTGEWLLRNRGSERIYELILVY